MKSFKVRRFQRHLAAVLAAVEAGEAIEVRRRGRPVARIIPAPSAAAPSDWSRAGQRLQQVHPCLVGGITAAETVVDGRGER